MRVATIFRLILPFVGLFLCGIELQAQTQTGRPRIGVALYGGLGASAASAIGFLQALDERNIPVDFISGSGSATFVAALYATCHTPEEMEKAFEELNGAYVDTFLNKSNRESSLYPFLISSTLEGLLYPSDYKIQRFLAQKFAKFDLNGGTSLTRPVSLVTLGMDLSTGELVQPRLTIAEAVRLSFASPTFLEPVQIADKILIGEASGQVAALRKAGADFVIAYFDSSFDLSKRDIHDTSVKEVVTLSTLEAHERSAILADLKQASAVTFAPKPYRSGTSELVRAGYTAFQQKAAELVVFSLSQDVATQWRNALKVYKDQALALPGLKIDSIDVKGNEFVDTSLILSILNLKTNAAFDLDDVLSSLDRLYATGYLNRCSFTFEPSGEDRVRIALAVAESEFLPLESLPKLEATINMDELLITWMKMNKAVNEALDEGEDKESRKKLFIAAIKALDNDGSEDKGLDRKQLIAAIKALDNDESEDKGLDRKRLIAVIKALDNDEGEDKESEKKKDHYLDKLAQELDDDLDRVKSPESLLATVRIGNLGSAAKHAVPKLASLLLLDEAPGIQLAATTALGAMGRDAKSQLCDLVGLLTVENANQRREAGHAIARISAPLYSEQDLDALDPLESAAAILDKDPLLAEYANSIHVSVSVLKNVQASVLANRADDYSVSELTAGSPLSNSGEVLLNGVRVKLDVSADQSHVQFLGPEAKGAIHQGINRLVKGKEDFLFWMEERKLTAYQNPYKNSYALVVAIDDYDRKKDSHYGGPTGYPALSGMVASAQALTDVLVKLGFPKRNIITLYDEQATSASVQGALASFWPGGSNESADRLFFYFGGHGDKYGDNPADKGRTIPFLVTYDFDKKKPTQTALLMRDLADRDSQNIRARHVIFALDACDSGLTLGGLGSPEALDQRVRRFQALSLVRRDTENVARNLLVAGTGDQQALWQNGGLFTKALVDGLKGEADLNNDGVIQFEELGVYVRNRVTAQAAQMQVRQDPEFRVLDQYGTGRIMFVK